MGAISPIGLQEAAYYDALGQVTTYRLGGGRLELTGDAGETTLVYTAE